MHCFFDTFLFFVDLQKNLNKTFLHWCLLLAVMLTSSFALIPARALQWPGYDLYNPQSTLHSGWPNVHLFVGQCNFSAVTNEAAPPHALWWPNVYTSTCTVNFSLQNLCLIDCNCSTRLEICQKIYTTRFFGKKFYTLKVCKLRLFLLKNLTELVKF